MTQEEFLSKVKDLQYLPLNLAYDQTGGAINLKRALDTVLTHFGIDTSRADVVRSRMTTHVHYAFLLDDIEVAGYDVFAREPQDQVMGVGNATSCFGDVVSYALCPECPDFQEIIVRTFDPYQTKIRWCCWHKTTMIVIDENTFGYTEKDTTTGAFFIRVMAVDYLRGGDPLKIHHEAYAYGNNWRVATTADFEHFKVVVKGYAENPDCVFIRQPRN